MPVELRLDRDAVYRVTYENLRDAGCDLAGVPASRLGLSSRGASIPIFVSGGPALGPGSFVEFVGKALESTYTRENVYHLTVEDAPARIAVDPSPPRRAPGRAAVVTATRRLGVKRDYAFASPTDDPWFDTRMLVTTTPQEWTFAFDLADLVGDGAGSLSLDLFGGTSLAASPDHHVEVLLGGHPLADISFDGLAAHHAVIPIAAGGLHAAGNRLVLRMPADRGLPFDIVHLQDYAVTYSRSVRTAGDAADFTGAAPAFEVPGFSSDAVVAYRESGGRLIRLAGTRARRDRDGGWVAVVPGESGEAHYLVAGAAAIGMPRIVAERRPASLLEGPAQYLVVSHPDFMDGLAPLLAVRRAQGLGVKVVDVRDVYAAYSFGIVDPRAIRDYIAAAARALGTEFVLLVGGDTYDYLGRTGHGARSFIPSLYAATDEIVRFAPVDPAFADVDGDGVPDLSIGRLPVRSREELAAVVAKTLAYERADYSRTATLVADRDGAGEYPWFVETSEAVATALGPGWRSERLYVGELTAASVRSLLASAFNAGSALISFVGHSAPSTWASDPVMSLAAVGELTNAERPSVVVQCACWNTYYVSPQSDSLGVALLLSPCGGAAASLGATSLADMGAEALLARLLADRLASPGARLGKAVLAAKRALAHERPHAVSVQLGWTLLGDPALLVGR